MTMISPPARAEVAVRRGLPLHQAFMALESPAALAINTGADRDLSNNWQLLPMSDEGYTTHGMACPTTRYNPKDSFYYVFGGGADIILTRSRDLKTWTRANTSLATGCISNDVCLRCVVALVGQTG